jgi:hypothetical protein
LDGLRAIVVQLIDAAFHGTKSSPEWRDGGDDCKSKAVRATKTSSSK